MGEYARKIYIKEQLKQITIRWHIYSWVVCPRAIVWVAIILYLTFHLRFFQLRSDSMASVYSGAGEGRYGTVAVRGQVEFGLQYNYKAGALEIHVKQCKDLAPVDTKRNRSDPYVKVPFLVDSIFPKRSFDRTQPNQVNFFRSTCYPTSRKVVKGKRRWRSTRSILRSMKRSNSTYLWMVLRPARFGWLFGIRTCLEETIS